MIASAAFATASVVFTGKERDSESGLDYFGARYYGSALGRWTSPDSINVTDDRLVNPSNTLNKYIYGGNNPLKFVDPDGEDITVYYINGGIGGHTMMMAYNQDTGDSAVQSFRPAGHSFDDEMNMAAGTNVPGTGNYDFSNIKSADQLRSEYASITSACAKVLKDIGLNPGSKALLPWTPDKLWNNLNLLYGKSASSSKSFLANTLGGSYLIQGQYKNGNDYGSPRYRMNTFDWLMLTLKAPLQGCVSVSDSASGSKFGGCK